MRISQEETERRAWSPIPGATYGADRALQCGCIMCGATIPERQAKFRSKVCGKDCRRDYRAWRTAAPAERHTELHCQVCRGPIPQRANVTWAETCGKACRNEMRRYRFSILRKQKCPKCYHPCTEEEIADWKAWRASRSANLQSFIREPHGHAVRKAFREAVALLEALREGFRTGCDENEMEALPSLENLDEKIAAFHSLVKPAKTPAKKKIDMAAEQ